MGKSFVIYCSGSASRIRHFYSDISNIKNYLPLCVIYDGESSKVFEELNTIFDGNVYWIDFGKLKDHEKARINNYTSEYIHQVMIKFDSEYLICFGDRILKKRLINSYKLKLINFHPSLLPSFKGLNAIDQALEENVLFLGNSVHYIDNGVDTGKIIAQSAMLKEDFEDYEDILELQFPLLHLVFRDILQYDTDVNIMKELQYRTKSFFIPNRLIIRNE